VPASALNTKTKISIPTVDVKDAGYIFVYLSYEDESNNYVEFDDFKVTHTKTSVIQYNEYYPFGLQTNNSWTRENNSNNYLYNEGNELNPNSGWYETFFRGYDPALGRFLQVDPMSFSEQATYQYAANNPVYYTDPSGASAWAGPRGSHYGARGTPEDDRRMSMAGWSMDVSGNIVDGKVGGAGMHMPGSGQYWADGWQYDDWSLSGGSDAYRWGLSMGMVDFGGRLYMINADGSRSELEKNEKGEYGYWVDDNYIDEKGAAIVHSTFILQSENDCPCWAKAGRAAARAFLPFGDLFYPKEEEPDYDPKHKVIAIDAMSLPIGPGGVRGATKGMAWVTKMLRKYKDAEFSAKQIGAFTKYTVTVPGNNTGYTVFTKILNAEGKTVKWFHDTFDTTGKFLHRGWTEGSQKVHLWWDGVIQTLGPYIPR
jgi:RHS repeat-associated protein